MVYDLPAIDTRPNIQAYNIAPIGKSPHNELTQISDYTSDRRRAIDEIYLPCEREVIQDFRLSTFRAEKLSGGRARVLHGRRRGHDLGKSAA